MMELTLESLAARLEAVEKQLAEQRNPPPVRKKDWRRTVGMFAGSEFIKEMDAECEAIREAGRKAGREGSSE